MPIYDNHKLIFIHVPKCAGTSINNFYMPNLEANFSEPSSFSFKYMFGRELQHITARRMSIFAPLRFRKYFKFSLVRNPYDRIQSEYRWRKAWDVTVSNTTFSDFLSSVSYRQKDPHFRPASDFIFSQNGKLLVDYVGKFEKIDTELKRINELAQLPLSNVLKKSNVTEREELCTEKDRVFIRTFYAVDFDNFEYDY